MVYWAGSQAVVTLPEHIDRSNADDVREQLLVLVNRGAPVIIADLAATISCDFTGADALARAYRRAIANGAQLRLVIGSTVVHRVLSINGLDRLVPVYPSVEAALAAGVQGRNRQGKTPGTPVNPAAAGRASETAAGTPEGADRIDDLLDTVVKKIFAAALILRASTDAPADVTGVRITEVLRRLDEVVQDIRQRQVTGLAGPARPDLSGGSTRDLDQRAALAAKHTATLRERLSQTAYAIHSEAADTAALLQQRGDLVTPPGGIDYPTEIKRWRALAELTEEMARRWEHRG